MGDSSRTENMAKLCTVKIPKDKIIYISLEGDFPKYVDYFAGVGFSGSSVITSERLPGDIMVFSGTFEDEYDIYLAATSAPVTVSGSIYMRDTVWEE